MTDTIANRAMEEGYFILRTGSTVRAAAVYFDVSKSTGHKDLTLRLRQLDGRLYHRVQAVLAQNKAQRHLRGGEATRRKYLALAAEKTGQ